MKKIIILFFIIMIISISGCKKSEARPMEEVFSFKDDIIDSISLKTITIYGRFFNLNGSYLNLDNPKLVLKNDLEELEYDLIIDKDNLIFKTNNLINEGINLETIKEGEYIILIKDNDEYYNFLNKLDNEYKNLEYYTITKNNKNYKITIKFEELDTNYLILSCKEVKLPKNVYDLVIDPGHGGVDVGAVNGKNEESKITLEYSLLLKEKLEKLGYKVKLTRNSDMTLNNYGETGRVSIPYNTKAKLMLSIHLNSSQLNVYDGGVEIYVPSDINFEFAKNMAKNIVDNTSTIYSKNTSSKIFDGVYLRKLSSYDLEEMTKDATRDNYKPYEKATENSVYYYIIRETGGIILNAYVDGRNKKNDLNPYYNSNHGCETYLVELGYISSNSNLDILLKEKDLYIDSIVKSIKDEFNVN